MGRGTLKKKPKNEPLTTGLYTSARLMRGQQRVYDYLMDAAESLTEYHFENICHMADGLQDDGMTDELAFISAYTSSVRANFTYMI